MPSDLPGAPGDPRSDFAPAPDGAQTRQLAGDAFGGWWLQPPAPPPAEVWTDPEAPRPDEETLHNLPAFRAEGPPSEDTDRYHEGSAVSDEPAVDEDPAVYDPAVYNPAVYNPAVYDEDGAEIGVQRAPDASDHRRAWPLVLLTAVIAAVLVAGGIAAWAATHRPAPLVAVPSLRGRTEAQASGLLTSRHLVLTVAGRAYDPSAPRGTVTGQTPRGGRLREHRPVAVTLSLGPQPVAIPSGLDGQSRSEASELVEAVGLHVGHVTIAPSITVPSGDVVSASPSSGTLLPGESVAFVVSSGKPSVAIPLLTGTAVESYGAAASALRAVHLVPSETVIYDDDVAKGLVIITDPAPRAPVPYGSTVRVEISDGPHYAVVPHVSNDTVATADRVLGGAGFVVSGVTGNPNRRVRGTEPAADRTVLYGSAVQLVTRGR